MFRNLPARIARSLPRLDAPPAVGDLRVALTLALVLGLAPATGPARADGLSLGVTAEGVAHPMSQRIALDQLAAMPQAEVRAVTPWTEGEVTFAGVAFQTLAHSLGVAGGKVVLRALNAYEITLDTSRVIEDGGVLATRMNGKPIPIRDKGPVWLVFPSAERPDLASADKAHMWIWQVDEIRFLAQ